jgi:hypothetical protein
VLYQNYSGVFIFVYFPCREQERCALPYLLRPWPPSPPRPFLLPVYVQQAATLMSTLGSPKPRHQVRHYDSRVLKYLDVEADEGIGSEGSSDDMD